MEKFRGEVKRTILIIASLLFIPAFACADDTIWNRVFFGDFTNIYDNAVINPVETSLVTAGFAWATYLVMKNDAWLASLITKNRSKAADNFYDFFNNAGDGVYVLAGDAVLFAVGGERERYVAQRIVEGMAVSGIISYRVRWCSAGKGQQPATDLTSSVFLILETIHTLRAIPQLLLCGPQLWPILTRTTHMEYRTWPIRLPHCAGRRVYIKTCTGQATCWQGRL